MAYTEHEWKRRIAERTDMSSYLVHLTRENSQNTVDEVLFNILESKVLLPSNTQKGYVRGQSGAVCFQDAPLSSISQNVFYEQKKIENNPNLKRRYRAIGLMFDKQYVYRKGGRPVIYDNPEDAKQYVAESEWWRLVNFNLDDSNNIVDWTHEREWRHKGQFTFELSEVTIVCINIGTVQLLNNKFKEKYNLDFINLIKGVVTLDNILC
ncbi:hypothetical protein NTE13_003585 [Vibrio cholerae]|uniref:hypothetical protein n=2 Tax=Vibrio cholerae TaxID=666 RepID=UPI0030800488